MPSRLRQYQLDRAYSRVCSAARFRPPQLHAFDKVHGLAKSFPDDLDKVSDSELTSCLKHFGCDTSADVTQLVFSLATGVGKTRLMGAIISYLYLSGQSRNFVILSSRTAVVEKLERESHPRHPKYLFLDPAVLPEANVCTRGQVETFTPSDEHPNVFILTPQSVSGTDRKFKRRSEFRGYSAFDYLKDCSDLVVLVDESHHLADEKAPWVAATGKLEPRLFFGFTATPASGKGVNVLYDYGLATCLREGRYTKAVNVLVEERDTRIDEWNWDKYTVNFALERLEAKRNTIIALSEQREDINFVEPVLLICAKDTDHADRVANWLVEEKGLGEEAVLVSHSAKNKKEDDVRRLVSVDQPDNKIKVIVNVYELTEGWDVTNVYVVAPLRAMATFQNAVQTMGRGLRLPWGTRVENDMADTLEVLCFGKETFQDVLAKAIEQFGDEEGVSTGINVRQTAEDDSGHKEPTKRVTLNPLLDFEIQIPHVERIPPEPTIELDLEPDSRLFRAGTAAVQLGSRETRDIDSTIEYGWDDFLETCVAMIIDELKYLSEPEHSGKLRKLVSDYLLKLGAEEGQAIPSDPTSVAMAIADEIDHRYKRKESTYQAKGLQRVSLRPMTWHVPDTVTKYPTLSEVK